MHTFKNEEELKAYIKHKICPIFDLENSNAATEYALKKYLRFFQASDWKWGSTLTKTFYNKTFCQKAFIKFSTISEKQRVNEYEQRRANFYCSTRNWSDREMDLCL